MRRIFEAEAYGEGPIRDSYWPTTLTAAPTVYPAPDGDLLTEVAIIGAGYTGLSAALHLARDVDRDVVVLDAKRPGFGGSGRNGGFCCIGGARLSDSDIAAKFGHEASAQFIRAQHRAIDLVSDILSTYGIEADTHSDGELVLAHRPKDFEAFADEAAHLKRSAGLEARIIPKDALAEMGAAGPTFYGGMIAPKGFALNPLKYALGLTKAAASAGAKIFGDSPVGRIEQHADGYVLHLPQTVVRAKQIIVATNGYGSEDVPGWLAGRYLPALSNVIVTRPLTAAEIADQGWSTDMMAFDTRRLLHYFRLMPDRRFLFGMRGGADYKPATTAHMRQLIRQDFERMFPAWAGVDTPYFWSGFVCIARDQLPFAGPIDGWDGAYAGLAYHGNGVAMGTYAGKLLAGMIAGQGWADDPVPEVMRGPLRKFPFAPWRRAVLPLTYKAFGFLDRG